MVNEQTSTNCEVEMDEININVFFITKSFFSVSFFAFFLLSFMCNVICINNHVPVKTVLTLLSPPVKVYRNPTSTDKSNP